MLRSGLFLNRLYRCLCDGCFLQYLIVGRVSLVSIYFTMLKRLCCTRMLIYYIRDNSYTIKRKQRDRHDMRSKIQFHIVPYWQMVLSFGVLHERIYLVQLHVILFHWRDYLVQLHVVHFHWRGYLVQLHVVHFHWRGYLVQLHVVHFHWRVTWYSYMQYTFIGGLLGIATCSTLSWEGLPGIATCGTLSLEGLPGLATCSTLSWEGLPGIAICSTLSLHVLYVHIPFTTNHNMND